MLLRRDGQRLDVPLASKRELAERILDGVVALRAGAPVPALRVSERDELAADLLAHGRFLADLGTVGVVGLPQEPRLRRRVAAARLRRRSTSVALRAGSRGGARRDPRRSRRLPALPAGRAAARRSSSARATPRPS